MLSVCSAVQCSAVQCSAVQCSSAKCTNQSNLEGLRLKGSTRGVWRDGAMEVTNDHSGGLTVVSLTTPDNDKNHSDYKPH